MELWNWSPQPQLINFKSEEIEVSVVSSAAKWKNSPSKLPINMNRNDGLLEQTEFMIKPN